MTSRDEALRALGFWWHCVEASCAADNGEPISDSEIILHYCEYGTTARVTAGQLRAAFADSSLSARQEVAPVAEYQVRPRGWTEESGWRKVTKREFDDHGPFPGYPDSEWERRCLCTSPAQTSEARDAVWLDWLERNGSVGISEGYHNGGKRFFELRDSDDNKLSEGPSLRAAIDAAMRQEAGSRE